MTTEKLNRLAELGWKHIHSKIGGMEYEDFRNLLAEWKAEQRDKLDLRQLKIGDVVRHKVSGNAYTVIETVNCHPVAIRAMVIMNTEEWIKVDK